MKRLLVAITACTLGLTNFAAADHAYYAGKQLVPIDLDPTHVAIHIPIATDREPMMRALDRLGLAPSWQIPWDRPGWVFVAVPQPRHDAASIADFIDDLLAEAEIGYVSPVFLDQYGPLVLKQDILVAFRRSLAPRRAEAQLNAFDAGQIIDRNWGGMSGVYRVRSHAADGFSVLDQANTMARHPDVLWAQPSRTFTVRLADTIPNDPQFPHEWHLHNTGQSGGVVDLDLDLPEAWDIEQGGLGAVVVVLDTGIEQTHADLNQLAGADFTGQGTAGGGPNNECDNHGTAVAGTISGIMNNSLHVVGVAPQSPVVSARVVVANVPCDGAGTGDTDDIVDALQWTQNRNYGITNSSLEFSWDSAVNQKYVDTRNAGIIHFAATGNAGVGTISFPASSPAVNAVTGIDRLGAHYGNFGTGVTFTSPARDIVTTDRTGAAGYSTNDVVTVSGTSFASPIAAGVASLLRSADWTLTPSDVEYYMQIACRDLGLSGYDTTWGYGLINAHNAVLAQMVSVCHSGLPSCLSENLTAAGCGNDQCCTLVCDIEPYCCFTAWDQLCAAMAADLCTSCGDFGTGSCHIANGTPSCDDDACCQTVCLIDPFCCENEWDQLCADAAATNCTPTNDDCPNAISIYSSGTFPFNNAFATTDGLSHAACEATGQTGIDRDVWYCFNPPTTGEVIIRTCGTSGVDTKIAVYDDCATCPPEDVDLIVCNDDSCGLQSQVQFTAVAGSQYMIRIGVFPGGAGGQGEFQIEYPNLGADLCTNATVINGTGTFSFDNIAALTDGPDHAACLTAGETQIAKDVWFCWVAPATGLTTFSTCGLTSMDTRLAAYLGCGCPPGDTDLIACNDDSCGLQSQIIFESIAGQSYLLRIGNYPGTLGGTGQFTLTIDGPPENDDCHNDAVVAEGTFFYNTTYATTDGQPLDPSCNEGAGLSFINDAWYRYIPTCTGQATISLCGSAYDSRLAVYNFGTCPPGNVDLLACNDDGCIGTTNATLTLSVTAGTPYLLRVGGYSGGGSGTLTISCVCPGDLNGDGVVNVNDLLVMLSAWGPNAGHPADLNGDGNVNVTDLLQLLTVWGAC